MKALFPLNSVQQLTTHAQDIAESDIIIATPTMGPVLDRIPGDAMIFAYWNAVAISNYPAPIYQSQKVALGKYLYDPEVHDPKYPAHPWLKPTPNAAEDYANFVTGNLGAFDGIYFDQCWKTMPTWATNLVKPHWHSGRTDAEAEEQILLRWRAYTSTLVTMVNNRCPVVINCAGDPPVDWRTAVYPTYLCYEVSAGRSLGDGVLTLARTTGGNGSHIIWGANGFTSRDWLLDGKVIVG